MALFLCHLRDCLGFLLVFLLSAVSFSSPLWWFHEERCALTLRLCFVKSRLFELWMMLILLCLLATSDSMADGLFYWQRSTRLHFFAQFMASYLLASFSLWSSFLQGFFSVSPLPMHRAHLLCGCGQQTSLALGLFNLCGSCWSLIFGAF